jgi:hypothetical protein
MCQYKKIAFHQVSIREKNVETDSLASTGGQGKYMKYVSFPWPPPEAAMSIFNVSYFDKTHKF